jgi:hypothetical protein
MFMYFFTYDEQQQPDKTATHNMNMQQTPAWRWSCQHLRWCGFDKSMLPKEWAALCILFTGLPLKDFNEFNEINS